VVRDSIPEVLAERGETLSPSVMIKDTPCWNGPLRSSQLCLFAQMALAEHYLKEADHDLYEIAMIDAIEADADYVYATTTPASLRRFSSRKHSGAMSNCSPPQSQPDWYGSTWDGCCC